MASEIDPDEALADIRRVAQELGEPPSVSQYREHGKYSARGVANKFDGSFVQAREQAGVADGELRPNSRDDLLQDIQRVAEVVGQEPSKDAYKEHGEYALSGITYRFESWIDAKKEAGVYDQENHKITRGMLIEDMQRVDSVVSGPLSQKRYDRTGKYTSMAAKRRFESWEAACQEAGVTRPDMGPKDVSDARILEDIRTVAEELERVPSKTDYNKHGHYSYGIIQTRFETWNTAVRKAGFEPNDPGGQPGERNANWEGGYEPYYGPTWYPQRRKARKRDGYRCRDCEKTDGQHIDEYGWELEVHHIMPVREFDDLEVANELGNLITLCREHHREYEELPANECDKLKEGC